MLELISKYEQREYVTSKVVGDVDGAFFTNPLVTRKNDVFLVFWNLIHNAMKCHSYMDSFEPDSKYSVEIKLSKTSEGHFIGFSNDGLMVEKAQSDFWSYFKPSSDKKKLADKKKGLMIVSERMKMLGWTLIQLESTNARTNIVLKVD